jgi:hypothetical protein
MQRTAESTADERYRKFQEELFARIAPAVPLRPESSVA